MCKSFSSLFVSFKSLLFTVRVYFRILLFKALCPITLLPDHYDPQQTGAAVGICEVFHAYGGAQSSELSTEPLRTTPSGPLSAGPRGLRSPSGFKVRGHEDSSVEFKYFGVF